MAIKDGSYLSNVRAQYEDYPYPARDPEDEKTLLVGAKSTALDCLNFYCFGGKRDFSEPFRVLVPGGGTGDCTIFLAEQLRDTPAEIVYLDMSESSMKLARERAAVRQLENITWVHDSILNLPDLDIGTFDFITCTGVLHHLEDPQAGLDALKSVLDEHGSMFVMVYATYGRTAVYQMQELFRRINAGYDDIEAEISNVKTVLKSLPPTNWFAATSHYYDKEISTDIGIYDLLLHTQDRAYTVPELYEYVEASDLKITKLFNPDNMLGDLMFEPETYIRDKALLARIKSYPFREQAAICELLIGALMTQNCFISRTEKTLPSREDLDWIPNISIALSRDYHLFREQLTNNKPIVQITQIVTLKKTPYTLALFDAIDGKRSIREVVDAAITATGGKATFDQILGEFNRVYDVMLKINGMYLRAPGLPPYPTIPDMQKRVEARYR